MFREPNLDRFNDDAFRERRTPRYDYEREDIEYERRRDDELTEEDDE